MKDYEYQAHVCNNALYGCLISLKASGVPKEDIRVMLDCMGRTLVKMSMLDNPIDYYINHFEDWMLQGGRSAESNLHQMELIEKYRKEITNEDNK